MKFISWNVNGFRAVLKKGFMEWLEAADPDILNLQEIRCEWDEIDLDVRKQLEAGYDICWFPSAAKKGYAGSATLSRRGDGWTHAKGLGLPDVDAEGRMIVSRNGDLTFIAGYFPNASAGLVRLGFKQKFAEDLAKILKARHKKGEQLVLAGDMNVAPEEIDLARPKDNMKNPGFTPEEREGFRSYLKAGMRDVLRERNPGVPGLYSWWTARGGARAKNVGWRIDIFLVSEGLVDRVEEAAIHAEVMGSDHCPVSLTLKA
ncbi:MAG: exodeoxyribonuclease III [Holophagaceae bacterium]|nr:exodeoxyribonuclease III [Holophagaceae bacterium]